MNKPLIHLSIAAVLATSCSFAHAKAFAECAAVQNPSLEAKINAIPRDDTILLLRGAVVGIDFQIAAMRECLPDPQARQLVDRLVEQRRQVVQTCGSLASSSADCLKSPF